MTTEHPALTTEDDNSRLQLALVGAQRGFRSQVKELIAALQTGSLLVPLSRAMANVPAGEEVELGEELKISPQLLTSPDGELFFVAFTEAAALEKVSDRVEWTTDGGPMEYCTLPALAALHVALEVVDGSRVQALVIDPGSTAELLLQRHELGSIAQGQELPLVGYVAEIPAGADESQLISELDEPPPAELVKVLDALVANYPDVQAYHLEQSFNRERDLAPHLCLRLTVADLTADRSELHEALGEMLEGKLPAPGYLAVIFETPPDLEAAGLSS